MASILSFQLKESYSLPAGDQSCRSWLGWENEARMASLQAELLQQRSLVEELQGRLTDMARMQGLEAEVGLLVTGESDGQPSTLMRRLESTANRVAKLEAHRSGTPPPPSKGSYGMCGSINRAGSASSFNNVISMGV
jgi:hypothetical protein